MKRRVSLPNNHTTETESVITTAADDAQTQGEFLNDSNNINAPQSPQKRPRSASTSTQVDADLFGKSIEFHYVLFIIYPQYAHVLNQFYFM